MESEEQFLDPNVVEVEVRLSFLKAFAKKLVPDLSDETVTLERRSELKRTKEETDIRIDELERLLKKMREN
jgi:hypothetical protein